MCNIYLQKLEPETKKINFTTSVLYQLNNDSPPQGTGCLPEPWTVQAAKEENNNNNNCKEHALTGHSQNPLYSQDN